MSDQVEQAVVLEPALTKLDLRVLCAVPAGGGPYELPRNAEDSIKNIWELGEALGIIELPDLLLTLNGLHGLGYICWSGARRDCSYWWRSAKGDAVAEGSKP